MVKLLRAGAVLIEGVVVLLFGLFGGAFWSVVFSSLGFDPSPQQYGSTPFIFALWFGSAYLLAVALNRLHRVTRA